MPPTKQNPTNPLLINVREDWSRETEVRWVKIKEKKKKTINDTLSTRAVFDEGAEEV